MLSWVKVLNARNSRTEPDVLRELAAPLTHPGEGLLTAIGGNSNTPEDVLGILAHDRSSDVREAVAANPSAPLPARAGLLHDKFERVRLAAATCDDIQVVLASAGDGRSRRLLFNIRTPEAAVECVARGDQIELVTRYDDGHERPEVLHVLAQSQDAKVRDYVLRNDYTAPETLEYLFGFVSIASPFPGLWPAEGIAKHRHATSQILEKLSWHASAPVRAAVARNPNTPVSVLVALAEDRFTCVAGAVAGSARTPPSTLASLARYESRWKAEEDRILGGLSPLRLGASADANYVRKQLELQAAREGDSIVDVRRVIAKNPHTPSNVIAWFPDEYEHEVAGNPSAAPSLLRHIAARGWDDNDDFWDDSTLTWALASNPSTPDDVLRRFAEDGGQYLRERVAGNGSAPIALLEALARDNDRSVREKASRTLESREQQEYWSRRLDQ